MKAVLSPIKLSFLILFFVSCAVSLCVAQTVRKNDVIIKRDSTKIEALIQEVDEGTVKYKKLNDPDGPIFSLLKKDIASINYGNGETENFPASKEQYFEEVTVAPVVPYKAERPSQTKTPNNSYQLEANYKLYTKKAATYKTMGIIGASVGILFTIVGIATVSEAVRSYNSAQISTLSYENKVVGGTLLTMTGLGAGIPLTIIGLVKRKSYAKKALKVEEQLRQRKDLSFHPCYNPINKTAQLGLIMNF